MTDGAQPSRRCARTGRRRRRGPDVRPLLRAAGRGRDRNDRRRTRSSRSAICPSAAELPDPDAAGYEPRARGGHQAERRPWHQMGMTGRQVAARGRRTGCTFLDIIAARCSRCARASARALPLVLMNSFRTRDDTLAALERYPELQSDVPLDFLQGKRAQAPRRRPRAGELARRPEPRVGAARARRRLHRARHLRDARARCSSAATSYAFISNSDNLGAVLEPRILGLVRDARSCRSPWRSCERTRVGSQGRPHRAARRAAGSCCARARRRADEDQDAFQDIERHRYFNTNNLWINLRRAEATCSAERGGVLGLPMIVNRKTVDPSDSSSPAVFQLETAMGAAIDVFDGAAALRVAATRFAPGEDDQRPARAALGRLRPRRGRARGAGAAAGRRAALRRSRLGQLQAAARLRPALPRGRAVARGVRPPGGPRRRGLRQGRCRSAARCRSSTRATGAS